MVATRKFQVLRPILWDQMPGHWVHPFQELSSLLHPSVSMIRFTSLVIISHFSSFLSYLCLVGDGKRRRAKALVFEFDGEKWEEIEKINYFGLDDRYQGNRAVAVDLEKSGFDEFCT